MSVNKIKIIRPTTDNYVDIPIEMKWDFAGHDDSISEYQEEMVKEIIGSPNDFEISRFSHNSDIDGNTDINYEFYFYDNVSPITATTVTQTNWGTVNPALEKAKIVDPDNPKPNLRTNLWNASQTASRPAIQLHTRLWKPKIVKKV